MLYLIIAFFDLSCLFFLNYDELKSYINIGFAILEITIATLITYSNNFDFTEFMLLILVFMNTIYESTKKLLKAIKTNKNKMVSMESIT